MSSPLALVDWHTATRWGLEYFTGGAPLEVHLIEEDFAWDEDRGYWMG